jgi:hypothetical protein
MELIAVNLEIILRDYLGDILRGRHPEYPCFCSASALKAFSVSGITGIGF